MSYGRRTGEGLAPGLGTASMEYQAFCRSELADPYGVLDQLRQSDPVHWSPVLDAWVVTSYQGVVTATAKP